MMEENDKILVGVSGGKDSMSLLKVLRYKQKKLPIRFDIIACYVDLGLDDERRRILEDYLKTNNYRYTIEEAGLWQSRKQKDGGIAVSGVLLIGARDYSRPLKSLVAAR